MITIAQEQPDVNTTGWSAAKRMLDTFPGIDHDGLHLLIGTLGFLFLAAILRKDCRSWSAWLIMLAIALANEVHDVLVDPWPDLAVQLMESAKDLILTMVIPTALLLIARFTPDLLTRGAAQSGEEAEDT